MQIVNALGQTLEPGVWVFRGGGNSNGGTNTRVGKIHNWSDKSKTWHVKWIFDVYSDRLSYNGDIPTGSNVVSSQLTTLDRQTVDRLDCILNARQQWCSMHPEPDYQAYTNPNNLHYTKIDYDSAEYINGDERYHQEKPAWDQGLKNYINDELNSRGLVPMP